MKKTDHIHFLFKEFKASAGITTDTRKINTNSIFFALRGERFDGNDFVEEAIKKGVRLVVSDRDSQLQNDKVIVVEDSLATLQSLASYVRDQWTFPVLAIAGSNGKTTTKELIKAALSEKFNVFSTPGNFNNHIGLPLSILMVPDNCEFVILELGANHLSEHAFLCEIAKPDFGIVTNNGKDHLEGYGSLENVRKSNAELYDYLHKNDGLAFVNADDQELMTMSASIRRETYGEKYKADFNAKYILNGFFAGVRTNSNTEIISALVGAINSVNIMAAYSIARYFEVNEELICNGIRAYVPNLNRSQLIRFRNFDVILDAYNSNPSSMSHALKTLGHADNDKKMVILGGMLELGDFEKSEHEALIEEVQRMNLSKIWLVGKEFEQFKSQENTEWFETTEKCLHAFESLIFDNGIALIKGSRRYQLEKLVGGKP